MKRTMAYHFQIKHNGLPDDFVVISDKKITAWEIALTKLTDLNTLESITLKRTIEVVK